MKTQLLTIRFVSILSFSLNNRYNVNIVVGMTMKVASHVNFKHQNASLSNQEVK